MPSSPGLPSLVMGQLSLTSHSFTKGEKRRLGQDIETLKNSKVRSLA